MSRIVVDARLGKSIVAPISDWSKLIIAESQNRATGWALTLPTKSPAVPVLLRGPTEPIGAGIVVTDTATGLQTPGFVTTFTLESDQDFITFGGVIDLALVDEANALPNPLTPSTPTNTFAYWEETSDAVVSTRNFLDTQVGPSAAAVWQTFDAVNATGTAPVVAYKARFEPVLTYVDSKATPAGVTVRAVLTENDLMVLEVYASTDRPNVVFTEELHTITKWSYTNTMPKFNVGIGGGTGEGTLREIYTGTNIDPVFWPRRRSTFLDRSSMTAPDLGIAVDELLVSQYPTLRFEGANSPDQLYGRDYFLGDTVRAEIYGERFTLPVAGVVLEVTPAGVNRSVSLGVDAEDPRNMTRTLRRAITDQFGLLENP